MMWSLRAQPEAVGDFIEAEGFKVRVLHPTRTLVEKLMILHHAAVEEVKTERVRLVRHYHDVWCLLRDEATVQGFEDWPCDALAKVGSDDCLELWAGNQVVSGQADAPAQSRSIGSALTRSSSP